MTTSNHSEQRYVLPTETSVLVQSQTLSKVTLFAWMVCFLGAFFYCYEYLLRMMPGIMEPELRRAFQLDATAFGNLIGFYYYAYTPMQFPVGILIDHYGPRRLLIGASFICALGSYLFAMETSLAFSQFGRFLVGFGSSFAFVGFLKLVTIWLPPKRFALVSGFIMTLCMLGVTQGNELIAFLLTHQGWKEVAILFSSLGVVIGVVMGLVIPQKNEAYIFQEDSAATNLKTLCKELTNLAKKPIIWMNGIVGCLLFLSLSGFAEAWGVSYFEQGRGYAKEVAVHLNNYVLWGWAFGGPFMGWLSEKIARRRFPLLVGSLGTAFAFAAILYMPLTMPLGVMKLMLFLVGVFSSSQILVFPIARELTSSTLAASALAFTNMLVMMGGAILQPGIGYLLKLKWSGEMLNKLPIYSQQTYQSALLVIVFAALVATVLVFCMRETYQKPEMNLE